MDDSITQHAMSTCYEMNEIRYRSLRKKKLHLGVKARYSFAKKRWMTDYGKQVAKLKMSNVLAVRQVKILDFLLLYNFKTHFPGII